MPSVASRLAYSQGHVYMVRMSSRLADDVRSDGETLAVRRPASSAPGREWTYQADEVYLAYGDGSANSMGSFYGMVLIPEKSISIVEEEIVAIKIKFGGKKNSRIHCRQIFHKLARLKTDWSHLTLNDTVALCEQACSVLERFQAKCLLAYMPKENLPKKLRLKGKAGLPLLVHRLDEKWLTLWAYFLVGSRLDPVDLIAPERPLAAPGPCNLPFGGMLVRRPGPGPKVRTVYLDREATGIRWRSESLPWTVAARRLTIETSRGLTLLPFAPTAASQPMLLELADLVTYSLAREIEGRHPIPYRRLRGGLDVQIITGSGEDIDRG